MSKHLKWLPLPFFIAVLTGLLIIRIFVFSDDGAGATIVIGLFWLVALTLFLKLIATLAGGEGGWEYIFLLVALLAFGASAVFGKDSVGPVTFIAFVMSLICLAIVWYRGWRRRNIRP